MIQQEVKSESTSDSVDTIKTVTRLFSNRELIDSKVRQHSSKVGWYSYLIAREIGYSEQESQTILQGAILHDIGKCKVPESIDKKPNRLTPAEFEVVKQHCEDGLDIVLDSGVLNDPVVKTVYSNIILRHHENYDGTGYPGGLKGQNIPFEANLVSVADIFDALLSERCYKQPWSESAVIDYINDNSGKIFYPELVDAFNKIRHAMIAVKRHCNRNGVPLVDPVDLPAYLGKVLVEQNIYVPFKLPRMGTIKI